MIVGVSLDGCDDSTYVEIEVDEITLEFLLELRALVNKTSTSGCEPKMRIRDLKTEAWYDSGKGWYS